MSSNIKYPQRGDIFWANLDPTIGSEINKKRPVLIVSNNANNKNSKRIIAAPITSTVTKIFSFEVGIEIKQRKCKILLDQIRSLDKIRLENKIMQCDLDTILQVNEAIKIALALKTSSAGN